ncbi:MAG: FHA domain-containing protein [Bdellovibrionales bacterium]|nr:FHA domain-containing protein [Bdellovibrionales bacterium]
MAKLVVLKGRKPFAEIELDEEQEYFIGRDQSCDVVLGADKGISRKHLVLRFDEQWRVELLSKMNNLVIDETFAGESELSNDMSFEVYPYYFILKEEVEEEQPEYEEPEQEEEPDHQAGGALVPHGTDPQEPEDGTNDGTHEPNTNLPAVQGNPHGMQQGFSGEDETVNAANLPALVGPHGMGGPKKARILNMAITGTETGRDELIQLDDDGPSWVAGRERACEIYINDSHVSRNHFKITREQDQFFLQDLGSANGTELNGESLKPNNKVKLISGDLIQIMDININLEVRDPNFEQQIEMAEKGMVLTNQFPNPGYVNPYPYPMHPPAQLPGGQYPGSEPEKSGFDFQKHKVRIAIAVLTPLVLLGLLLDDGGNKNLPSQNPGQTGKNSVTFEKLTPEQQAAVKDKFNLAQQHFHNLKYANCLSELRDLHGIIPLYENSKELKTFCEQGAQLLKVEKDRAAREKRQRETEQRIQAIVDTCESSIGLTTTVQQLRTCMSDAIELNPANPRIQALIERLERRDAEKAQAKQRQAAVARRIAAGRREFKKAQKLQAEDQLNAASKQYEKFLNGGYPSLKKEKTDAKRELASVKAMLNQKVEALLTECEALRSNAQYKKAYQICDVATKESPKNKKAITLKKETLSDLRKEMKSIYEDSILEESLGNVEAAKEKWKKIMQNDLEFDDYYKKAKRKLKKYGEGI